MRDLWERFSKSSDPGRTAVVDDHGVHSADSLVRQALVLSEQLSASGAPATVLVRADSSWRLAVATLAVGRLGGTLVLISKHATAEDYAVIRDDVAMDLVVAPQEALETWGALEKGKGVATRCLDGWRLVPSEENSLSDDVARWRGGSLIGMTSGSTGRAKAVVQSEAALRYAVDCTLEINGIRPSEPIAGFVPLSSAAAFCFGLYLPMWNGSPAVLHDSWKPREVLERINSHAAVWTMCVPTMLLQLANAVVEGGSSTLRSITVGGGPMREEALAEAESSLGAIVLRVFGMSEALGHTSPSLDDPQDVRLSLDGRPFPGTELRAVDASGTPVRLGEVGRAQVRGPSVFLGYARDGAAAPREDTADGFFPTGDLIRMEANGSISVAGRETNIIIRGGRNIDVTKVELAILQHPEVEQVCVVPVPDDLFGERVAALLVSRRPPSLRDLQDFLAEVGLAKTNWPEFVYVVAQLPITHVGKLSRVQARLLGQRLHEASGCTAGAEMQKSL